MIYKIIELKGLFIFIISIFICISPIGNYLYAQPPHQILPIGYWRGEILRKDGNAIIFNFETRDSLGKKIIYVINGSEKLLVDHIERKGDSAYIEMPFFDSRFALRILSNGDMEGIWIKNHGEQIIKIPFHAYFGEKEKFVANKSPSFNISGRWSVTFKSQTDSTEAIGEFRQTGAKIQGTFLTITGDYRFLNGIVNGDTLKLSTFDGGHAYSFVSLIQDSEKMSSGSFFSGATSVENWEAHKNENARLPDEFSLTKLKDSANAILHFQFPDLKGRLISTQDSIYKNKVIIVQILGSWCPNCMDECRFLVPFYDANKKRGVEVIGLAYERTSSYNEAKKLLLPFVNRLQIKYPIAVTGVSVNDSLRTEKTLPEIQKILGFPTTIFIDKKGKVRKIHTGFTGPGTGDHYEIFIRDFNDIINDLLKE
jgi:thiol-disulfide isomerase/thioredoxin